jgi:hypothetical protein
MGPPPNGVFGLDSLEGLGVESLAALLEVIGEDPVMDGGERRQGLGLNVGDVNEMPAIAGAERPGPFAFRRGEQLLRKFGLAEHPRRLGGNETVEIAGAGKRVAEIDRPRRLCGPQPGEQGNGAVMRRLVAAFVGRDIDLRERHRLRVQVALSVLCEPAFELGRRRRVGNAEIGLEELEFLGDAAAHDLVFAIEIERQALAQEDFLADIVIDQACELIGGRGLLELLLIGNRQPLLLRWADGDDIALIMGLEVFDAAPDGEAQNEELEERLVHRECEEGAEPAGFGARRAG